MHKNYIYIATTINLEKRCIYKVGMAVDVNNRMKTLNGYASKQNDMWYAVYKYEIPSNSKLKTDKDFHKWFKDTYHIIPLSSDELNKLLKTTIHRSEKELYCGISAESLYNYVKECFTGNHKIYIPKINWSTHAKTSLSAAIAAVFKLKNKNPRFFDLKYKIHKICDISCRDEVLICAALTEYFNYSKSYYSTTLKCITDIMQKCIYAYCLDKSFNIIKQNILTYISGHSDIFKDINITELENSNIFKNFQIKYSEDYCSDTTMDVLKDIKHKKFDAILINPPYATAGGGTLHLQFVEAALKMSDKVVAVFPFDFIYRDKKQYKKFKTIFDNRLVSVEEKSSKDFEDTYMKNVGIYDFEKNNNRNITIIDINGASTQYNTLIGLSKISNIEQPIFDVLKSQSSISVIPFGSSDYRGIKKQYPSLNETIDKDKLELQELAINHNCKKLRSVMTGNNYVLVVNNCRNNRDGKSFTTKNGQISNNFDDIKNIACTNGTSYNAIVVKTKVAAENLKNALNRPLLRFSIYRKQIDQHMPPYVYEYIPNIDWSSPKTKTDEGILEMCGCNYSDAIKYVEYATNIMYRVDHGERP